MPKAPKKVRHLGPRKPGRTFNNDIMRGESAIPADGLGPGTRTRQPFKRSGPQSASLASLTHGTSIDPYRDKPRAGKPKAVPGGNRGGNSGKTAYTRGRTANAEPAGGGGGKWREMQDKLNKSRAQTSSLANGLTVGTTIHPYDGTDPQTEASATGTSIFDPVLAELVYRWFCPPGGLVLDPFAGGSVRGIVASRLGRQYLGIDLRPEQVAANEMQAKLICKAPLPKWICGDSLDVVEHMGKRKAHLIFSCPPYADLEVYSEDERDLSTMGHGEFLDAYRKIIADSAKCLADDSFACFVIGDARDEDGFYYGLPWRTVDAFEAAGVRLYNNAILVTAAGSLPIRTAKQFTVSRKLGTTHQHVLVFCKGDPREATNAIGAVDFGEIEPMPAETPAGAPAPAAGWPQVKPMGGEV